MIIWETKEESIVFLNVRIENRNGEFFCNYDERNV